MLLPLALIDPDRVAKTIVDVVRRGRAPQVSIPRAIAALEVFRVVTPPVYRWFVRRITERFAPNQAHREFHRD